MDDVWLAVLALGSLLQVVGLATTAWGVTVTKGALFPTEPQPGGPVAAWTRRAVAWAQTLGRRPSRDAIVSPAPIGVRVIAINPRVKVTYDRPAEGAPLSAWASYLVRRLDAIEQAQDNDRAAAERSVNEVRTALDTERDQRVQADQRIEALVIPQAIGGEAGHGLDRAWSGLIVALVGVALNGLASLVLSV